MDKTYLIKSAESLNSVSKSSADEYNQKTELLIAKMNNIMCSRADIESLVGKNNINMMKDNHSNHIRFMVSIFKNYNADVLVETVLWVFKAYRSHGFASNYWAAQLNNWVTILEDNLAPECYVEVLPYYEWLQVNIPLFEKVSAEKIASTQTN